MLPLSSVQQSILEQASTQPTYLVDIEWDGESFSWSTRGEHIVAGAIYTSGDVGVRGAQSWRSASIAMVPTAENVQAMLVGDWVGNPCVISLLPIKYHPQIVVPGYAVEDYGFFGTETGDPIILLDGVLCAAEYSGNGPITLSVRHRATMGQWAPRTRLSPPICNHLPTPGTTFTWAGETYTLEART